MVVEEPEFTDVIENMTVAAGRNVRFACSVKNLGTYKVSKTYHIYVTHLNVLCEFSYYIIYPHQFPFTLNTRIGTHWIISEYQPLTVLQIQIVHVWRCLTCFYLFYSNSFHRLCPKLAEKTLQT